MPAGLDELIQLFHQLWGKAKEHPENYDKAEWNRLQKLLNELGVPA